MRNLLVSLSAASVLFLIGCGEERHSMRAVPDRNGHAATDPTGKELDLAMSYLTEGKIEEYAQALLSSNEVIFWP